MTKDGQILLPVSQLYRDISRGYLGWGDINSMMMDRKWYYIQNVRCGRRGIFHEQHE